MEVAGNLGTPLGLAQRKRASPRGEAGTSGFPRSNSEAVTGSLGGERRTHMGPHLRSPLAPATGSHPAASPRGEALFRCARPSGVPRGPATSTGSLASQRHAIAQSPGREAALAWASLAQRFPASSVLAREGAGCGSEGTTRRGTATPVHRPQRPAGSTHSSTRGLRPPEQLERPAGFPSSLQAMQEKKALSSRGRGRLWGFLELRRPWGFSPEARRGSQGASRAQLPEFTQTHVH